MTWSYVKISSAPGSEVAKANSHVRGRRQVLSQPDVIVLRYSSKLQLLIPLARPKLVRVYDLYTIQGLFLFTERHADCCNQRPQLDLVGV